jgi:inositol transport system substrate-binding protein
MEYLGELMGGKGKIVVMRGGDGHPAARDRTLGVKQVIEEQYPDIEIVAEDTAKWDRALGQTLMENWINQGLEFNGVAANNDEMAIGAILALQEAGMADDVFVVGVDGTPDALAYVEAGLLSATVFQNAMGQGAGSVEAAYTLATGGTIEKMVYIPYELVTPDNLQNYVDLWAEAGWVMESL